MAMENHHFFRFISPTNFALFTPLVGWKNPQWNPPLTRCITLKLLINGGWEKKHIFPKWWFMGNESHGRIRQKSPTKANRSTLPETNIAPENRPSQKETSLPTIHFQERKCEFQGG